MTEWPHEGVHPGVALGEPGARRGREGYTEGVLGTGSSPLDTVRELG